MKSKLIFLLSTIIIGVLTIFLVFQFMGLAVNTEFNRNYSRTIIAQIHLTNVQFVVNSDAISRGYFIVDLTFKNPTNESLTLTRARAQSTLNPTITIQAVAPLAGR